MTRCISLFMLLMFTAPASAQRAVILVRHAEREAGTGDVGLSATGKKRAEELARVLADSGIDAIFTTNYLRTKQSAEPIAGVARLTPQALAATESAEAWVKRLAKDHADQTVLIVGHSNTVPGIIDAFMKRRTGIVIGDDEFDKLFILIAKKDGGWSLVRSRY